MPARLKEVHPVLMCRNVAASVKFYVEKLGFERAFQDAADNPHYAGVRRDCVELHFQWHSEEEWEAGLDVPTYRFYVEDVDGLLAEFKERGAVDENKTAEDKPWGTYEFGFYDPDKNGLHFYRDL